MSRVRIPSPAFSESLAEFADTESRLFTVEQPETQDRAAGPPMQRCPAMTRQLRKTLIFMTFVLTLISWVGRARPLEDIRNTQQIHAVVVNSRFLDRGFLDNLLKQAGARAKWMPYEGLPG